jgi:acyl carrier protein
MSNSNCADVRGWLQQKIAVETGDPLESISMDAEFESFRLDSLSLLSISYDLENEINIEITPSDLTEFNTINKLSRWIETKK